MAFLSALQNFDKKGLAKTTTIERKLFVLSDGVERKQPEKAHRVVILSKYSFSFDTWLSKKHVKVLLTSSEVAKSLPFAATSAYRKLEGFDNYEVNGNVERRALELHAELNFTHVVALCEEDLIRAARLRQALGIRFGQSVDSALRFRDKVLMKQVLQAKGIAVPTFAPVDCPLDVINFVKQRGLPVGEHLHSDRRQRCYLQLSSREKDTAQLELQSFARNRHAASPRRSS